MKKLIFIITILSLSACGNISRFDDLENTIRIKAGGLGAKPSALTSRAADASAGYSSCSIQSKGDFKHTFTITFKSTECNASVTKGNQEEEL